MAWCSGLPGSRLINAGIGVLEVRMQEPIVFIARDGDDDALLVAEVVGQRNVFWLDPSRTAELVFGYDQTGGPVTRVTGRVIDPRVVWRLWPAPRLSSHQLPVQGLNEDWRRYVRVGAQTQIADLDAQFPHATWISDPVALEYARSKPRQQALAARAGFEHIPDTLQGCDLDSAAAFIEEQSAAGRQVVVKDVSRAFPASPNGNVQVMFTSLVQTPQELVDDKLLSGPKILQRYIPGADVRVTIVGDEVFATRITIPEEVETGTIRDHRSIGQAFPGTNWYEPWQLPPGVERACRELQRLPGLTGRPGLAWCAIDLRLDPDGVYWFLEINVDNVVFGDIERATGQPISHAMARLLTTAARA
jgi:glutathione synthase/RimK-type ligase-like ATP-grasp enzyme